MTLWTMHEGEVPISDGLVRDLIAAQAPRWSGLPLRRVPSDGTDNAVYRLGEHLTVRLPRIGWAAHDTAKEARWLPWLAPQLPLPIPVPLFVGQPMTARPGPGYPFPWNICPWIEGRTPQWGQVQQPRAFALALADFVRALQAIPAHDGPPASRGRPIAELDESLRQWLPRVAEHLDPAPLAAAWARVLDVPAWTGDPVWVHGDLLAGNLLVGPQGDLRAVIDFGGLGTGDPAIDLLPAWALLGPAERRLFRAALNPDAATWARGRGWALHIAAASLGYYWDSCPPIRERSLHLLGQALADQT